MVHWKFALALCGLALVPAAPVAAADLSGPRVASVADEGGPAVDVNYRRRYAYRDCKPYNGPYGYYGNPYCEGGFSRYGRGGGYEIDLTPYFDERYYNERRYRRWR